MKRIILLPLVIIFVTGCQDKQAIIELKAQAELEVQNIDLIERLFEEINNNRNIQIYDELCDPKYSFYSPSTSPNPLSLGEVKGFAEMIINAFPDVNYSIKEIFAKGDYVIVWNIFSGTHKSDFQGIPATGNKIEVSSILIFHIQNGKILEEREEADMLGAMIQFGMELQMKQVSE